METNVHITHIVTDTVHTHMYIHGDTYTCSCNYTTQLHSITAKCA